MHPLPDRSTSDLLSALPADVWARLAPSIELVDLPLGTVKSWIRRGTQSLKHCMES